MNKTILLFFFAFLCKTLVMGQGNFKETDQPNPQLTDLLLNYQADQGSLSRFYFVENAPERRERLKTLVKDYELRLPKINFNSLNTGSKVDYILFNRNLKEALYQLDLEEKEYNQLKTWFPFAYSVYQIEKARRRGNVPDSRAIALQFSDISKQLTALKKQLKQDSLMSKDLAIRGENTARGLIDALKSVYEFYNGYDPQFTWWIPKPYARLDSLLNDYAATFKKSGKNLKIQKDDGSGIIGNPIGRDELNRRLQFEMIPYTPEELVDIANKEFAWCDAEMLKASKEMGLGNNWKAALEKLKNLYVLPSQQPDAMVKIYQESIDFLNKNDLITIPPLAEETWRMIMMTPERQLVNPFFTGGEEFSVSYPTNTMTEEQKLMSMRGNNPHFSRATVHHELIPGHALQEFMTYRYKNYRHFETPFWIEGWALYWEMLLYDLNFPRSAEDRVGMLFWRMHRCARIIFSLNYHTGKWTPRECIDFLINRVGHEPANAEGEVRRSFVGGYDPLYQIAYMIGGLQIRAMKNELVDTKKMTYKQFHDGFMQQNMLPIEMVRAILTNQPLSKDFKSNWRFYKLK